MTFIANDEMLLFSPYLAHHGIKGMRWYHRRWQNEDGTLTPAGIKRYRKGLRKELGKDYRNLVWNKKTSGSHHANYKAAMSNINKVMEERGETDPRKVLDQFQDEILGAKLKDLGKEDTAQARKILKDILRDETWWQEYSGVKTDKEIAKAANSVKEISSDEEEQIVKEEFSKLPAEEQDRYRIAAAEKQFEDDVKSGLVDKINKSLARIDMSPLTKEDYIYEAIYGDGNEGRNAWKEYAKDRKNREGADKTEAPKQSAKSDKPEYIDKVETKNGDTRYFYDKDELKAYKDGRTGASDADLDKAFKKMRNTAKTGEEVDRREDAWDQARDNGLWDLNFLEAVQNSVALEKGDTKTLLTEYAYYLADPEQYLQDRDKYLKDY